MGSLVAERAYGTGEMSREGVLREGVREGSGAGVRVRLEYVENVFPSWLYGSVLGGVSEDRGNLTARLTEPLTTSLTPRLPRGLTFSGFRGVERAGKGAQETAWRPWRRSRSAAASTLVITP